MKKIKNVEFFGGKKISKKEQENILGGLGTDHPCPGCRCSNSVQGFEGPKTGLMIAAAICHIL